ncbi:BNR-4 repeat-containing protein [Winogradskyella sp. R77965]|uniref:T9SS type A sorting domain-containing protein n=1 Tax=Winogradskyella sp. R77965 TaxID=3093872 RepID=UPI0037DC2C19
MQRTYCNGNQKGIYFSLLFGLGFFFITAQVVLENEVEITDIALHFDGVQVNDESAPNSTTGYDYKFGPQISAHGDCITTYNEYVFMTWYRGGKADRHMMLTRYNTITGTMATIEFPHQHTGWRNIWYIGESHNTIGIGVSPLDGTIHLLFDMHAYTNTRPSDGSLSDDYFRYSYSIANAASVSDAEFTLDKFVQNANGGYKHLSLNGVENYGAFSEFTYPKFFLNNQGDLFFSMRKGSSSNGGYHFAKYDAATSTWSDFIKFADKNASNYGQDYNWGMYGRLKYVGGKIRIGFQRRSRNNTDKYLYQNGLYYAYSDDQSGATNWKNHEGTSFNLPLRNADEIKLMEPGDYVQTTQTNQVYIVGGFDWTVTENGDEHIISRVKDNEFNVTKNLHTYRPAGATDFITTENFSGAEAIYTSGDDIFLIGLSSGRVRIQKAVGGTNNFTTVYQPTTGRTFRHGIVYIADGKLYYYLMENGYSDDTRPLYLQIIDLDIVQEPFRVSLTSPFNDETYNTGETIPISADAVDENGSISKVEFLLNGVLFGEDTTEPYALDWTPDTEGAYDIQAIAYNANNETVSSNEITVNIQVFDPNDLTGDVYRIKNFVTGKYMHSVGADVVESNDGINIAFGDKEWEFVQAGNYYNIESKRTDRGILRSAGNPPNDIINTGFGAPREDSDKQFTVIYNSSDGTYQFETRNGSNYIYHNSNGIIEHVGNSDDRSKWIVESTTLSTLEFDDDTFTAKIFPNPAKDEFTILLNATTNANVIIYNMLGKVVYEDTMTSNRIDIKNNGRFKSGLYLIKVVNENQRVFHSKLMIR